MSLPVHVGPHHDAPGAVDDIGDAVGAPVATDSGIGSPCMIVWLCTVDVDRGGLTRGDCGTLGRPRASGGSGGRGYAKWYGEPAGADGADGPPVATCV